MGYIDSMNNNFLYRVNLDHEMEKFEIINQQDEDGLMVVQSCTTNRVRYLDVNDRKYRSTELEAWEFYKKWNVQRQKELQAELTNVNNHIENATRNIENIQSVTQ